MSGHSKWSTIKHKKAVIDAKRGGVFTKMANAISVAVKKGGGVGDPDMNFSLRLAVDKARAVNMPKENIDRAIEKGLGKVDGKEMYELVLEGYAPGGLALIIEAVSDNHNRTVNEIKNTLEKNGGRLGEPGSVMYQFDRVGQISYEGDLNEEMELELIDCGMSDFESEEGEHHIFSSVGDMRKVIEYLKNKLKRDPEVTIIYKPKNRVDPGENSEYLEKLTNILLDYEDVQEIYDNSL